VPPDQLREGTGVAPLEPTHQLLVGRRVVQGVDAASTCAPSIAP
jgi:hypothetical protein